MKNKLYFTVFFSIFFGIIVNAQIKSNQSIVNAAINLSSIFLDASSSTLWNGTSAGNTNVGKGFAFPNADLSTLILTNNGSYLSSNNPNKFDGMVVYNTVSSVTTASGISVAVTPGFYYFSNPNKSLPNVTSDLGGIWTSLGSNAVKDYTTTEVATSTSINGKQVYAIKGGFTTTGTNALITITKPSGMTGYYKMTTYQNGMTFRNDISSFNMDPLVTTDNVVTGSGLFSEVYPLGDYTYTLEYFK